MDAYTRRCRPTRTQGWPEWWKGPCWTRPARRSVHTDLLDRDQPGPAQSGLTGHSGSARVARLGPVRPSRLAISDAPTLSFAPVARRPPAHLLADARCRETASQLSGRVCMVTSLPPGSRTRTLTHACAGGMCSRTPPPP